MCLNAPSQAPAGQPNRASWSPTALSVIVTQASSFSHQPWPTPKSDAGCKHAYRARADPHGVRTCYRQIHPSHKRYELYRVLHHDLHPPLNTDPLYSGTAASKPTFFFLSTRDGHDSTWPGGLKKALWDIGGSSLHIPNCTLGGTEAESCSF